MRKLLTLAAVVVVSLFVCTSCASAEETFYSEKKHVEVVDLAPELNATFREAVEPSIDYEIKDTFVTIGYYGGSPYCTFHVLSTDGEYYRYEVRSVKDAERLYLLVIPDLLDEDRPEDQSIGKFFLDGKELVTN